MNKEKKLLLGAHMSTAGGFHLALERGQSIGCTAIQLFTKSNRQWKAKPISEIQAAQFKTAYAQSSITIVVAHAAYLINLGSSSPEIRQQSVNALIEEINRCDQLGIPYLVLHPGTGTTGNADHDLSLITRMLDEALSKSSPHVMVLLETMAGQGTTSCYRFEHIAQILATSQYRNNLGVCFDTCHAFAAGYDFSSSVSYEKLWTDFDAIIGLNHLKVIHLNDSKKECGSRVDRHEHIGQGKIGREGFRLLCNDQRFMHIPKILETPKDSLEQDSMNIKTVYELLQ